ncbi:MAG: DegT/DnrJ/EryC1/StrS family aminotransferase [Sulfurimonadaceae bacterium]
MPRRPRLDFAGFHHVVNRGVAQSHTYFPIVFKSENEMKTVREALLKEEIAARQYFSPSLDTVPFVQPCEIMAGSRDIASRILVIPMHSGVEPTVAKIIIETLERIR